MNRLTSDFENVIGVKDSSGSLPDLLDYRRVCPSGFKVFAGLDTLIVDAVISGCAGVMPGLANLAPTLLISVYEHAMAGHLAEAKAAQHKVAQLRAAFTLGTFPAVIKEAAAMLGLPVGPVRRPVQPLGPEARRRLRGILASVLGEEALV